MSLKKMKSLLKSKKGVETSPLFLVFSAVVLILTASIAFPAMIEWQKAVDRGKAIRESIKLKETIDEIHTLGDVGSVERVYLLLPAGYKINVESNRLVLTGDDVSEAFPVRNVRLGYGGAELTGGAVIVAFWEGSAPVTPSGAPTIWVYNS